MGGFASGPGGVAAWICRRPLIIHEQNAVPGLTNSLLSRIATKVLQGFPGAFPAAANAITVGNPVRRSIVSDQRLREFCTESTEFNVLVVGGSRGAASLNEAVPNVLRDMQLTGVQVRHQCGVNNVVQTRSTYGRFNANVDVSEFIDDMGNAYRWASVVICRAGALTISELAAAGVASILVPYPHAVDDHQTVNAKFLVERDGALLVPEGPCFERRLAAAITKLHSNRKQLRQIAMRAHELATPEAANVVAGYCRELLDG
jgi:UDP-N-acetylglucosamine--N-acetylmuramyl-(pentapeptide) pyrophosphoryl-undecaprenol N-acetylglucosamine transferase